MGSVSGCSDLYRSRLSHRTVPHPNVSAPQNASQGRQGAQRAAWCRTIEAFEEGGQQPRQVALFPEDRTAPVLDCEVVHVRLAGLRLRRPRQWGACWLACELWDQL